MKKTCEHHTLPFKEVKTSRLKNYFAQNLNKVVNGNFTCPICREKLQGMANLASHIKKHCT